MPNDTTDQPTLAVTQSDSEFLRDLAARLYRHATPAMGFEQGDTDRLYRMARTHSEPRPVAGLREALEKWRLTDGYVPAYLAGWNAMLGKALELAAARPLEGPGDASVEAAYRAGWAQALVDETMRGTVEAGWRDWDQYRQYLLSTDPTSLEGGEGVERLRTALAKVMPVQINNTPDYAEAYFGDGQTHSTQAMTMNPQDWFDVQSAFDALAAHPSTQGV